jgi:hypothetical protein
MTVGRPRPHNTACICAMCMAVRKAPSARSVNLYGLTDGPQPKVGPIEAQWIRERMRALLGHSANVDGVRSIIITEEALFAAVRSGRIKL